MNISRFSHINALGIKFYHPQCNIPSSKAIVLSVPAKKIFKVFLLFIGLGCLLMRTIASFQRYTGYLNFINGPISRALLLILVHVQLPSCLLF